MQRRHEEDHRENRHCGGQNQGNQREEHPTSERKVKNCEESIESMQEEIGTAKADWLRMDKERDQSAVDAKELERAGCLSGHQEEEQAGASGDRAADPVWPRINKVDDCTDSLTIPEIADQSNVQCRPTSRTRPAFKISRCCPRPTLKSQICHR